MDFTLLHFNEESGQVTVGAGPELKFVIDVPIEDDSYIGGEALYSYVEGFIPREDVVRRDKVAKRPKVPDTLRSITSTVYQPELTYIELRAAEYPPIMDYIDGVVKGDAKQIQAFIDASLAVKAKYPKPLPEKVSASVLAERREL